MITFALVDLKVSFDTSIRKFGFSAVFQKESRNKAPRIRKNGYDIILGVAMLTQLNNAKFLYR